MPKTGRPITFTGTILGAGLAVVVDFHALLGQAADTFTVVNDGPGNLSIEISNNGVDYGGIFLLAPGDGPFVWDPPETARQQDRDRTKVARIRLDEAGANVTYRGIAV